MTKTKDVVVNAAMNGNYNVLDRMKKEVNTDAE